MPILKKCHTSGQHRCELHIELRSVERPRHPRVPGRNDVARGQPLPVDVAEERVRFELLGVAGTRAESQFRIANQQPGQQIFGALENRRIIL